MPTLMINRQFRLKRRPAPDEFVRPDNFELYQQPVPRLREGEVLLRVLYIGLAPSSRTWLSEKQHYGQQVAVGDVMRGTGLGRVVASRSSTFVEGELVQGALGWQDYAVFHERQTQGYTRYTFEPPMSLSKLLGACGGNGLIAYAGVTWAAPQRGETFVVTSAAGAIGSIAGQIAKIHGARVIGITNGANKCSYLLHELGFDGAIDYKTDNWRRDLELATPDGIDVSFEIVGGAAMRAVQSRMVVGGRIALSGLMPNHNDSQGYGVDLAVVLAKQLTLRGLQAYADPHPESAIKALIGWLQDGRLKLWETIVEGLEQAPDTLSRMLDGRSNSLGGRVVIHVS